MADDLDFHSPQLICKVEDKKINLQGFLVMDTLLGGHCAGGIRMTPDVTEEEVKQLAWTMSMKFGFLNIYMGGAKAGIILSKNNSHESRDIILKTFGQRIGFILKRGIYYPGTDIGTSERDLRLIEAGAGIKSAITAEDNNDSGYFTALVAVTVAREIAKCAGIDFKKAKVIIEGFGKVGSAIADLISDETTIIGLSTVKGAIVNNKGLDIGKVKEIKGINGDDIISAYKDAETSSLDDLLASDSDILFLCGKPRVLNLDNVNKIKAKIVIGAGNLCFEKGVEAACYHRGIYVLPDFVTSCGGVLGLTLKGMRLSFYNITKLIQEDFALKINNLIKLSWPNGQSPVKMAPDMVRENISKMQELKVQKKQGTLRRTYDMLVGREWKSLTSRIALHTVPGTYYYLPKIQDYLLLRARESFRWK